MERLTYDFCIGDVHCWQVKGADNLTCKEVCSGQDSGGCKDCPIAKAFDRLAAYEDAGLDPEEIKIILERYHTFRSAISDETGQPMVSWTRAGEICRADKDGRLAVLPIPVGAGKVAYGLTESDDGQQYIVTIECDYLERLEIWENPGHEAVIEADGWEIREPDIGKIVFLTREEAEAALKKREEAGY